MSSKEILENAINQAISDFDSIKAAIESKGVIVPKGTDTKDYGMLIRSIVCEPIIDTETTAIVGKAVIGKAIVGI